MQEPRSLERQDGEQAKSDNQEGDEPSTFSSSKWARESLLGVDHNVSGVATTTTTSPNCVEARNNSAQQQHAENINEKEGKTQSTIQPQSAQGTGMNDHDLEHRRLLSRQSSRRSQERKLEKIQLLCEMSVQLHETNLKLKLENSALRGAIDTIRLRGSIARQPSTAALNVSSSRVPSPQINDPLIPRAALARWPAGFPPTILGGHSIPSIDRNYLFPTELEQRQFFHNQYPLSSESRPPSQEQIYLDLRLLQQEDAVTRVKQSSQLALLRSIGNGSSVALENLRVADLGPFPLSSQLVAPHISMDHDISPLMFSNALLDPIYRSRLQSNSPPAILYSADVPRRVHALDTQTLWQNVDAAAPSLSFMPNAHPLQIDAQEVPDFEPLLQARSGRGDYYTSRQLQHNARLGRNGEQTLIAVPSSNSDGSLLAHASVENVETRAPSTHSSRKIDSKPGRDSIRPQNHQK